MRASTGRFNCAREDRVCVGCRPTLSRCRSNARLLDTTDRSGTTTFEVLPYVDLYAKNQLLKDRTRYTAPFLRNAVLHRLLSSASGNRGFARGVVCPRVRRTSCTNWRLVESRLWKLCSAGPAISSLVWTDCSSIGRFQSTCGGGPRLTARPDRRRYLQRTDRLRTGDGVFPAAREFRRLEKLRKRPTSRLRIKEGAVSRVPEEMRQSKLVLSPFGFGEIKWVAISNVSSMALRWSSRHEPSRDVAGYFEPKSPMRRTPGTFGFRSHAPQLLETPEDGFESPRPARRGTSKPVRGRRKRLRGPFRGPPAASTKK